MNKLIVFGFLLFVLFFLIAEAHCRAAEDESKSPADGKDKDFASQASEVIDNALLSVKNSFNDFFEDGTKISSFFTNITNSFKKLTDKEQAATPS